ncbi:hypothetical protein G7054_g12948 [Neopestalotiopsis clavispora]|nr:hypothetical protein G7054_g12948 [Neopestalotiopsis clavispora]
MPRFSEASNNEPKSRSKSRPRKRRRLREGHHTSRAVETEVPTEPEQSVNPLESPLPLGHEVSEPCEMMEDPLTVLAQVGDDSDGLSEEHQTSEDPFTLLAQVGDDSEGEDCALHIYEDRFDMRGMRTMLRVGTKTEFDPEKDRSHRAGFVSTKHYSPDRSLLSTDLEIRSPLAKKAIREVIHTYAGVNINGSKRIIIQGQPTCLFHYRKELRDYAEASSDLQMKEHVLFCIRYMETTLGPEIETYNALVTNTASDPGLDFKNLWMAYVPGDHLYNEWENTDFVTILKEMSLIPPPKGTEHRERPYWSLRLELIDCNGKDFGLAPVEKSITFYEGTRAFQQLEIYPLRYHKDEPRLRSSLVARGRKFVSMSDSQYCQYDGDALVYSNKAYRRVSTYEGFDFDDLIEGKGKGLIVLLHGPPGVGKTFTAESIADHTHRPLMRICSDELTSTIGGAETKLSNLLFFAKKWDALVLLDEADVFMQRRALYDLTRNTMVAILLRVLEYFEGIMFLTTNRVETIDDAFKSRVHLSLSYPKLDVAARLQLWTSGLTRACRGQKPIWATMKALMKLASANVNGRNIKNIIRLGCGIAKDAGRELKRSDIRKGLRALENFEADFEKYRQSGQTRRNGDF